MAMKGDFAWGAPHESIQFRKRTRKLAGQLNANADERIGIGEFARGISREQRDWSNLKTRPIARSLSEILRKRLGPGGQDQLVADAQAGTGAAYDKARAGASRSAARYGVKLDPELNRGFGIDRTKSMVEAGNRVAQIDRDSAVQDAGRFYQSGASLPGMATQQYVAGAGSLVDQHDYATGLQYGEALGQIDAQEGVGMGFANAFADGGVVDGERINGVELDAIRWLRKKLTGSEDRPTYSINKSESEQLRELDGEPKREYADGGGVGFGVGKSPTVELNTGDFIVPEHAEEFYGHEFWDKLVTENGGDVADVDVGEAEGYADGGGVGFGVGIEEGYAGSIGPLVGNLKRGLTRGLLGAQQAEEHEARMAARAEDRTYLRGEREYQSKQREKAEQKDMLERELAMATAEFMRKDGTDLTPIINVQRKHFGSDGTVSFIPNADGKTYKISSLRADGSEESPARDIGLDELRKIGVGMIKTMRDPKALEDIWKKNEHWTSYGGGLGLLERNSGRTKPGLDPETLLSVRGRQPAGPKAVRYPQRGMILDAEDMLKSDPDLANLSEDDRKALSINVASRAQALLIEQPGIDASEAIAQALDEERANIAPGEKRDLFGFDWLARDKAPAYQDRRRAAPTATTPAEQALRAKMGAPARNTAPAANEPTAVNPNTGERVVYRNGQWQPLK